MNRTGLLLIDLQLGLLEEPGCAYRGSEIVSLAADLFRGARLAAVPGFHVSNVTRSAE